MAGLVPYLFFTGTARQALGFYRSVFGGDLRFGVHWLIGFEGDG